MNKKEKSNDIFLIDESLPQKLKNELQQLKKSNLWEEILSLFEYKEKLTLDEIMVGLYKKYKTIVTRRKISTAITNNIKRKGKLKRVGIAIYKKIKEDNNND